MDRYLINQRTNPLPKDLVDKAEKTHEKFLKDVGDSIRAEDALSLGAYSTDLIYSLREMQSLDAEESLKWLIQSSPDAVLVIAYRNEDVGLRLVGLYYSPYEILSPSDDWIGWIASLEDALEMIRPVLFGSDRLVCPFLLASKFLKTPHSLVTDNLDELALSASLGVINFYRYADSNAKFLLRCIKSTLREKKYIPSFMSNEFVNVLAWDRETLVLEMNKNGYGLDSTEAFLGIKALLKESIYFSIEEKAFYETLILGPTFLEEKHLAGQHDQKRHAGNNPFDRLSNSVKAIRVQRQKIVDKMRAIVGDAGEVVVDDDDYPEQILNTNVTINTKNGATVVVSNWSDSSAEYIIDSITSPFPAETTPEELTAARNEILAIIDKLIAEVDKSANPSAIVTSDLHTLRGLPIAYLANRGFDLENTKGSANLIKTNSPYLRRDFDTLPALILYESAMARPERYHEDDETVDEVGRLTGFTSSDVVTAADNLDERFRGARSVKFKDLMDQVKVKGTPVLSKDVLYSLRDSIRIYYKKPSSIIDKHLPGRHDQKKHAGRADVEEVESYQRKSPSVIGAVKDLKELGYKDVLINTNIPDSFILGALNEFKEVAGILKDLLPKFDLKDAGITIDIRIDGANWFATYYDIDNRIEISKLGRNSVIHEFGHYFDARFADAIGKDEKAGEEIPWSSQRTGLSDNNRETDAVLDVVNAIQKTDSYRRWVTTYGEGDYLVDKPEMFARAFDQYVFLNSSTYRDRLLKWKEESPEKYIKFMDKQGDWLTPDEFSQIEPLMNKVFRTADLKSLASLISSMRL